MKTAGRKIFIIAIGMLLGVFALQPAHAAFGYHAAQKAVVKKIAKKGFATSRMKAHARFGKGVYLSSRPATAMAEARGARGIVRFRTGKGFQKRTLDVSRPNPGRLHRMFPGKDLRGSVKKGVVGPKLGKSIGRYASRKGKVVRYRSARVPGAYNYYVPKKVYEAHPRMLRHPQVLK